LTSAGRDEVMKESSIFRKASLDRLASPEQLDQLLPVTESRGWVALGAVGVVLTATLVWGLLGRIPQQVTGTGILVKSGGVLEVISLAGGMITDVSVNEGDSVSEGQVVARAAQPEVSARLQQARATLAYLRDRHQQLSAFRDKSMTLQRQNLAQQRSAVEQSIGSARRVLRWTDERIAIQEHLVEQGLLLKQTLLENKEKHHQTLEQVGKGRSELAQIAVQELDLRNQLAEQIAESQTKVADAERTVEQTTRELRSKTEIVSPYTGKVLEVLAEQGMVLTAGESVIRLDLAGRTVRGLEAVIFVPSTNGKQIQVGMPVLIAPANVKKEEFGLMVAKVSSVSDFPATVRGMERVLKNEKLVSTIAGADAPYEVHAELTVDPTTLSKYAWSSSKGPPVRIRSGTLATASIAVSYRRPIQLLLPLIREQGGI
jgi:HlyD family secretion protein